MNLCAMSRTTTASSQLPHTLNFTSASTHPPLPSDPLPTLPETPSPASAQHNMDIPSEQAVRLRHALRCAAGNTAIAFLGLMTTRISACLTSIFFMISTVAGSSLNYQGFQLRSASLAFLGSLLGVLAYALVAVIAHTSPIATFFVALPFLAFFTALRTSPKLTPMPALSNVILGFQLISFLDSGRAAIPNALATILTAASVAWALANLVNLIFPDRATDAGRVMIASEMRRLGSVISSVAGTAFHTPRKNRPSDEHSITEKMSHTTVNLTTDGFPFFPEMNSLIAADLERTDEMITATNTSLRLLRALPPFGSTRVEDYAHLAKARHLLSSAKYEPRLLPESAARWRDPQSWTHLVETLSALVGHVSSLESVVCPRGPCVVFFTHPQLVEFLGEAYIPIWISHMGTCAAACANLSRFMSNATCSELLAEKSVMWHPEVNPDNWRARRAEMYFGFILRYRLAVRNVSPSGNHICREELRNLESASLRPLDLQYNLHVWKTATRDPSASADGRRKSDREFRALDVRPSISISDRQAMSFFALECHAVAEAIGHVQQAMLNLAETRNSRGWLAPFHFLISAIPLVWERVKEIALGKMRVWEVRFAMTHILLLAATLALALFLPLAERYRASEIAWTFASAALVAQLSAEPTLFISCLRVAATVTGSFLGLGFTSILAKLGSTVGRDILYLQLPYVFMVTIVSLLFVPVRFRYAAFLFIVTNGIMMFCPRSTLECRSTAAVHESKCLANWEYAVSRSVNVSVGVVLALAFHLLLWPRYANDEALRALTTAFSNAVHTWHKLRLTYFSLGLSDGFDPSSMSMIHSAVKKQDGRTTRSDKDGNNESHSHDDENTIDVEDDEGDIYPRNVTLLKEITDQVGVHVTAAVTMVETEANVWGHGPFRLRPILGRLLPDFIALTASLSELCGLLGRRPLFSKTYRRDVFVQLIRPLLREYETLQISVNNVVAMAMAVLTGDGDHRNASKDERGVCKERADALRRALQHVARCHAELRSEARRREGRLGELWVLRIGVRARLLRWSGEETKEGMKGWEEEEKNMESEDWGMRRCMDDVEVGMRSGHAARENKVDVDDVVLYDAMTLVADACLSAFVRIGVTVLTEAETAARRRGRRGGRERGGRGRGKKAV